MAILKASEVKRLVKEGGKRCSKEFIEALEAAVAKKVAKCVAEHNGGKKTVDAEVVGLHFGA